MKNKIKILHKEYSSYRDDIISYFDSQVLPSARTILDPMAGTAPLIPYATKHGVKAFFNDILPLHYFINRSKTASVYNHIEDILKEEPAYLAQESFKCLAKLRNKKLIISDQWIPEENLDGLMSAWEKSNQYEVNVNTFIKSIILLCIRPYSSISRSEKNATWYQPGGMSSDIDLHYVIEAAIAKYLSYYDNFYGNMSNVELKESCTILMGDAEKLKIKGKIDVILTSPAYANRYDIVKMYGPELFFLAKLGLSPEIDLLKNTNLATNVVTDYQSPYQDLKILKDISPKTYGFLIGVQKKQLQGEKEYYLRYFTKYYSELYKICDHLMGMLSDNGSFYLVVQNNIHRGEENKMDDFIEDFFTMKGHSVERPFIEMRHHQGRRNISADHPLVVKKHPETILRVMK